MHPGCSIHPLLAARAAPFAGAGAVPDTEDVGFGFNVPAAAAPKRWEAGSTREQVELRLCMPCCSKGFRVPEAMNI